VLESKPRDAKPKYHVTPFHTFQHFVALSILCKVYKDFSILESWKVLQSMQSAFGFLQMIGERPEYKFFINERPA
jgi:hypothetical protein